MSKKRWIFQTAETFYFSWAEWVRAVVLQGDVCVELPESDRLYETGVC